MPSGPGSFPRVVVRPPNWLGDAVMALPALTAVRRHFAGSDLTVAASPAVAGLFRDGRKVTMGGLPDAGAAVG